MRHQWRRYIGLALLLGLAAGPAAAQSDAGGATPRAGMGGMGNRDFAAMRMEMMLKGITLTDDQKVMVESIVEGYKKDMPAPTPGTRPDPETMQKRRELMQKQDADIRAVLTPEQQNTWDKNAQEMRNRRRNMGGGPPPSN